jgi:hypothetical protein
VALTYRNAGCAGIKHRWLSVKDATRLLGSTPGIDLKHPIAQALDLFHRRSVRMDAITRRTMRGPGGGVGYQGAS